MDGRFANETRDTTQVSTAGTTDFFAARKIVIRPTTGTEVLSGHSEELLKGPLQAVDFLSTPPRPALAQPALKLSLNS